MCSGCILAVMAMIAEFVPPAAAEAEAEADSSQCTNRKAVIR